MLHTIVFYIVCANMTCSLSHGVVEGEVITRLQTELNNGLTLNFVDDRVHAMLNETANEILLGDTVGNDAVPEWHATIDDIEIN